MVTTPTVERRTRSSLPGHLCSPDEARCHECRHSETHATQQRAECRHPSQEFKAMTVLPGQPACEAFERRTGSQLTFSIVRCLRRSE